MCVKKLFLTHSLISSGISASLSLSLSLAHTSIFYSLSKGELNISHQWTWLAQFLTQNRKKRLTHVMYGFWFESLKTLRVSFSGFGHRTKMLLNLLKLTLWLYNGRESFFRPHMKQSRTITSIFIGMIFHEFRFYLVVLLWANTDLYGSIWWGETPNAFRLRYKPQTVKL